MAAGEDGILAMPGAASGRLSSSSSSRDSPKESSKESSKTRRSSLSIRRAMVHGRALTVEDVEKLWVGTTTELSSGRASRV